MKDFLLIVLVFSLLVSACAPVTQPPQPKSTQIATPIPIATETPLPTSTLTLTATPTLTPLPGRGKEIVNYDGKEYVLNEAGIPIFVAKGSEWEPFTRPVEMIISHDFQDFIKITDEEISRLVESEIDSAIIKRLVGENGEELPTGYWFEWQPYPDDPSFTHVFLSGIVRGCSGDISKGAVSLFLEIPKQWERDVLTLLMSNDVTNIDWTNSLILPASGSIAGYVDVSTITGTSNVMGDEFHSTALLDGFASINDMDIYKSLCQDQAVGRQITVSLIIPFYKDEANTIKLRDLMREGRSLKEIADEIIKGNKVNYAANYYLIPEDLLK